MVNGKKGGGAVLSRFRSGSDIAQTHAFYEKVGMQYLHAKGWRKSMAQLVGEVACKLEPKRWRVACH